MAPNRKKRTTPTVVGTVSTRSTRRESVVNVEIVPKPRNFAKRPTDGEEQQPLDENMVKTEPIDEIKTEEEDDDVEGIELENEQLVKTEPVEIEVETQQPAIIDILKDWSEDEDQGSSEEQLLNILEGKSPVKKIEEQRFVIVDQEKQKSGTTMTIKLSNYDMNNLNMNNERSGNDLIEFEFEMEGSDTSSVKQSEDDLCERIEETMRLTQRKESQKQISNHIEETINEVVEKYSKQKAKKIVKKKLKNEDEVRRRSDRLKTITTVKKQSRGVVKSKSDNIEAESSDNSNSFHPEVSPSDNNSSPAEVKPPTPPTEVIQEPPKALDMDQSGQEEVVERLNSFIHVKDNSYKTERQICKEAKGMVCDCYLAEEDIENDEYGCGDDCLNRLLMIECGEHCQARDRCTNRRFQRGQFAPVEVFKTEKKGLGLRARANIAYGEFILEYVGEVLDADEFDKRAEVYAKDKNMHFYFMSLRADAIIDATFKGNISRFINHSCDPNAETQKWTVNGELRIGFFSTRTILAGEEITFDYRFQRYGKEAQRCYCESAICRGWLGEEPGESDEDDDEDEAEDDMRKSPKPAAATVAPINKELEVAEIEPKMEVETTPTKPTEIVKPETPKTPSRRKPRKEILYEDFDQLDEDIDMLMTTGLKNQAHTLKVSRLMVRSKDLEQRKKLLRILRRGDLPCRRLFLDYHGLRLMHGYMIDAQSHSAMDSTQTKLELLQTLAVLPIQSKTMLIESKVLPAVEKWSKNEDIVEDSDHVDVNRVDMRRDPRSRDTVDEIQFLAAKLLEEWTNLKESFKIPKKQRIEQMKEHEKEANRKFLESSYAPERESSRKNDTRYRTWSRCKMERESNKRFPRFEDKPSAEFLKISKHERRKLFALQMEVKEEQRRKKQRELWLKHEMNCMMIGADPRFTAPFDPSKGFQYIWNPSIGQWQALPVPQGPIQQPPPIVRPYVPPPQTQFPPPIGIPMNIPPPNMTAPLTQPPPPLPAMYTEMKEDVSQVRFAGPIPPPVTLPPKWRVAKDKYGRPYYYHVKLRKTQWEPPKLPPMQEESSETSSSETSSDSSSASSSETDSDDDIDDSKLLQGVRKQIEAKKRAQVAVKKESDSPSPDMKVESELEDSEEMSSIDLRLKQQFNLDESEMVKKKRRIGLCQEIIISPRTDEDRAQYKEEVKRYKATKEKLKRQKLQMLQQAKRLKSVQEKKPAKTRIKDMKEWNDEHARKIKELFRSGMATTVVSVLNAYRKPECHEGRITNTEDFKHLARKLTHFVMLKEIKHISKIDELVCTDNVKGKAREYIRKYMSKFGETYQKRHDEPDFKD